MALRKARKPGRSVAKRLAREHMKGASISEMSRKLDRLEWKIDLLRKQQEETNDDVEESLEAAEETEKDVEKIEHGMGKMGDELDKIPYL